MSEELKPVRCGCGGVGEIVPETRVGYTSYYCDCQQCGINTDYYESPEKAVEAWNRAMSGNLEKVQIKGANVPERTAKVIEHDASVTDTDGYKYHRSEYLCGACKKKVIGGDEYCSHCGCRLIWGED